MSAEVERPVVIAVLGTHSTGKSTFLARLAHELRCGDMEGGNRRRASCAFRQCGSPRRRSSPRTTSPKRLPTELAGQNIVLSLAAVSGTPVVDDQPDVLDAVDHPEAAGVILPTRTRRGRGVPR